jgi:hypothetical protein
MAILGGLVRRAWPSGVEWFPGAMAMLQPRCENCGQLATIHETAIIAGKAASRHFCLEHGKSSLPPVDPGVQGASLREAEEYYRSLSDAEREHMALVYRLTKRGV